MIVNLADFDILASRFGTLVSPQPSPLSFGQEKGTDRGPFVDLLE